MSFGDYLVALREERGVPRRKLHERTGLSLSHLHEIEKGDYLPGVENLRKIAKALRVDPDEVIRERDRVEFDRMGLDADATILLKELGPLSDEERKKFMRVMKRVAAERK